jgi:hypothetical protein
MIWGTVVKSIFGGAVGLAKEWLDGKVEESRLKKDIKLEALKNEGAWERIMAEGTHTSWKDEFFTLILSVPIILVGYAVAVDDMDIVARLQDAFVALQSLPEWYQYLLFIAVTASFGIKGAGKVLDLAKKR